MTFKAAAVAVKYDDLKEADEETIEELDQAIVDLQQKQLELDKKLFALRLVVAKE